jgi:hypothetical protein
MHTPRSPWWNHSWRLALVLALAMPACMAERGDEASRQPHDEEPESQREVVVTPPSSDPLSNALVQIDAASARAKGLPELSFSLDFRDTAFTVMPYAEGSYLRASGPPGGPLSLVVSPITRDAEFGPADAASGSVVEQVELLGEPRRAVAWISGSSQARTSHCSILVAPARGDHALLLELGVGHQGPDVTCKTALAHEQLAKVIASLRF